MARQSLGVWEFVTLGTTTVACLAVGLIGGLLLDRHLHTLPLYTLVGITAGILCGCLVTYVRIRQILRE